MSNGKDNPQRVGSLSDLGKLVGGQRSAPTPIPAPTLSSDAARHSAPVSKTDRAGRAPYNFVPLPQKWTGADEPLGADQYHEGAFSGEIDLNIEALSDFYIRGMWTLAQFTKEGRESKDQLRPFEVDGKLRLPGSSLRGMIRNLVEILGKAPLEPVNTQQLFFRSVGASDNPQNERSFEPQAVAYKGRIVRGGGDERFPGLAVQTGYLTGGLDTWTIQPAKRHPALNTQWYRIRTNESWKRDRIHFIPGQPWARICRGNEPGEPGYLVCSGLFARIKRAQWIIHEPDLQATKITVPEDDVKAYLEGGRTQEIEKNRFEYSVASKDVPCFYVDWTDAEGVKHFSFGHTPYFRLPYRHTTSDRVPPDNKRSKKDENRWDLAQAIFGRTASRGKIDGAKGRVSFEDATLIGDAENPLRPEQSVVLGTPKPTTYQHYLVQKSDVLRDAVHWDGNYEGKGEAVVRGHKLYWHRIGAPVRQAGPDQKRVSTTFQSGRKGLRFRFKIRYENLRPYELGALLTALDLPEGCAHRLGMGKPLGLGSFRIRIAQITAINREERYRSLFNHNDRERLCTGMSDGKADGESAKEAFAEWYFNTEPKRLATLWQDRRLAELKALLTVPTAGTENWLNRTRYLEFGKIQSGPMAGRIYNEYNEVGQPNRRLQKRRPLPPATQVLEGKPNEIPSDPRPPFAAAGSDRH